MARHRVPMPGSLRRFEDPAHSADPAIRAIVARLSTLEVAPPPRAHFRAELRAQLVAVTPRLVAEGVAAETSVAQPAVGEDAAAAPERRSLLGALRLGRPLRMVTAIVAVLGLLLGGAVIMSRNALPGDTLYGLKRASESFQLATAGSSTDKAADLLDFAGTRVDEVTQLLGNAGASAGSPRNVSGDTASLVTSTLASADSDVQQASRLLGSTAVQRRSGAPLAQLSNWAPTQLRRLAAVADRLPAGDLHNRVLRSAALVQSAQQRAAGLAAVVGCGCMATAASDSLGPVPCTICTVPGGQRPGANPSQLPGVPAGSGGNQPGVPGGTTSPGGTGGRSGAVGGGGTAGSTGPGGQPVSGLPGGSSGGINPQLPSTQLPTVPPVTLPPGTLPAGTQPVPIPSLSLPIPSVTLPKAPLSPSVSIGTSGIHINLGGG